MHARFEYIINNLILLYYIIEGWVITVANKEPNNQEDEEKKRIVFFFLIVTSVIFGFCVLPEIYEQYDKEPVVVYTLSKEQLEGYGYTEKESFTVDIWDSEAADDTGNTRNAKSLTTEKKSESLTSEFTSVTVSFPLDINSASADELKMVKGIGEVTANKIVAYRGINGYFYSLGELLNVDGIGKKKLASLNGYLYIDYDSLPETLPYVSELNNDIIVSEYEHTVVTTVPPEYTEMTVTVAETTTTEDDFVMETEEFITETDVETEVTDLWDLFSESYNLFKLTESEYYPNFPIELNSASVKDLTYIKGIGESTASKIVEYARTVGFTSVEDLLNISGIGKSKLEVIRPYVFVDPVYPTYVAETGGPDVSSETFPIEASHEIYKVNINTCDKNDLMQLPGIDEALADDIIELREQIGYFVNIEELSFALSNEKLSKIWNYVFV